MDRVPTFLFVPSNDSMVHWMLPIAERLTRSCFMVLPWRQENADVELRSRQKEFVHYEPGQLAGLEPSIVVLGNDWGREERQIILEARVLGIPSVCIQEGAMSLRADELMNAEYLFAQGPEY